jgi:hypothetical protein
MPGYHKKPKKNKVGYDNSIYSNKPKFLKGLLTKDDGSMSMFGNIANIWSGGILGAMKSGTDMIRGGNRPLMKKPKMYNKKK